MTDAELLGMLECAAIAAGAEILLVRETNLGIRQKSDCTPVTQADERAEAMILEALSLHYPEIPVVAEEQAAAGACPLCPTGRFFLVDALDGTRDFIKGRDEFTVNIALIDDGFPLVGVIYAPAKGRLWRGSPMGADTAEIGPDGNIVSRRTIRTRPLPERPLVLKSVSHRDSETEAFLAGLPPHDTQTTSSSLKFCILAEGLADVYPRLVSLMQWDTAAGDAVLRAAGGVTFRPDGNPLVYGLSGDSYAVARFVSLGDRAATHWLKQAD